MTKLDKYVNCTCVLFLQSIQSSSLSSLTQLLWSLQRHFLSHCRPTQPKWHSHLSGLIQCPMSHFLWHTGLQVPLSKLNKKISFVCHTESKSDLEFEPQTCGVHQCFKFDVYGDSHTSVIGCKSCGRRTTLLSNPHVQSKMSIFWKGA